MKKYYVIGIIIFMAGVVAYHFIAERQAEQQFRKTITELNQDPATSWSLQYSSLDISAFSGDIELSDITFIDDQLISRAGKIEFDLGYLDFLRIYLGGLQFGLEYLEHAEISLETPVQVDRQTLREVKFNNLDISYSGNAWDLLRNFNRNSSLQYAHSVQANSPGITIALPETTLRELKASDFSYTYNVESGKTGVGVEARHEIRMNSLNWHPSEEFQQKYSFFIKGFGYPTDAIPFESARFVAEPVSESGTLHVEAELESELALLTATGNLWTSGTWANARWQDSELRITDFSNRFSKVLENIEQLLSVTLPQKNGEITLYLQGTLSNTNISLQPTP